MGGRAWRGGGRGGLLSQRDLGGDVSKGASAFEGLCLPNGIGGQVLSASSLCNKERQEMGSEEIHACRTWLIQKGCLGGF